MSDQLFVQFPLGPWIPNEEQIRDSGNVILQTAIQALGYFIDPETSQPRSDSYGRIVLSTGQDGNLVPYRDQEADGQLVVSAFEMYLGRAGEQRFQFPKGVLGGYAQKVVRFQVQLARKAPVQTGGFAPRLQQPPDILTASSVLWTDTWIVWSALIALAAGGLKNSQTGEQLSPAPITQDNVLVGPMTLDPPQGGINSSKTIVEVQY